MIQPDQVYGFLNELLRQAHALKPGIEAAHQLTDSITSNITGNATDIRNVLSPEFYSQCAVLGGCLVGAMFDPECYKDLMAEARKIYNAVVPESRRLAESELMDRL